MLGEPERTSYDVHFSLFGIPVRVHPFFWLIMLMLGPLNREPVQSLLWVCAAFFGILIHELGHATVMRTYGFQPWIVLYGFGGLTVPGGGRSWGSRAYGPVAQIAISLAGPFAGFALAAAAVGIVKASGMGKIAAWYGPLQICPYLDLGELAKLSGFVNYLVQISVFWGLLNLLPIYPLDGGQVARELLLVFNRQEGIRQSLMLSALTGTLMAVYALVQRGDVWMAVLFGYLAYQSFAALQAGMGDRY